MDYVAVPEELRLGCYRSNVGGTGRFAKGIMNDCKIYNIGISDDEIISATRWHTLGKINMTTFEKIIFIADKIEKRTRPLEHREPIEKALEKGLDSALLVCYGNTIKSLVDRNLKICFQTIDIYNKLLNKIDSKGDK